MQNFSQVKPTSKLLIFQNISNPVNSAYGKYFMFTSLLAFISDDNEIM
ncbi:21894_t:CDS:2 [Gigaspora rosea]|nr:21894_t:CDS:2 [Gigaspora rosea]